jgi:hypothetical protein
MPASPLDVAADPGLPVVASFASVRVPGPTRRISTGKSHARDKEDKQ